MWAICMLFQERSYLSPNTFLFFFFFLSSRQASSQTATSTQSVVTERDVRCLFRSLSSANKPALSILLSWQDTQIHCSSVVHQPASTQQLCSGDKLTAAARAQKDMLSLKQIIPIIIPEQRISGNYVWNTTQNYWWWWEKRILKVP